MLNANSERKVKVIAQYKKYYDNVEELPNDTSRIELGFEIDYIQADKECKIDDETVTEIPFGEESGKTYEYEYCILEFLE